MPEHGTSAARSIKKWLKILTVLTVLLYTVLGLGILYVYDLSRDSRQVQCGVKQDKQRQVAAGKRFLKQHPNGAFGFTEGQIRLSIAEGEATVESMSVIDCPPPPQIIPDS